MLKKVFDFCEEKNLINENDYVVAGISGGADSVCLLFVLLELRKKLDFALHVVHINHGIREEAGEDAEYVRSLCDKYKLPFSLVECKVEEYAKQNHLSCEEAGRLIRYEAFYDTLAKNKGQRIGKIAIAHNENDLAETFLFNLFRGSGLKGLSGIQAKREEIIRPLLCVSRNEIEGFLAQNNIKYMVDKTNLSDDYTRNRIRHHILPQAEENVQGAIGHIKEAAAKIEEAYDLIEEMTNIEYNKCVATNNDTIVINKTEFIQMPVTMRGYVAKRAIEKMAGKAKDITAVHVNNLCEMMEKQVGRKLSLPYNIVATRIYEGILLDFEKEKNNTDWEAVIEKGELGKEIILPNNDRIVISVETFNIEEGKNIPTNTYTKWFDYDKIKGSICIRNRRVGDFLVLDDAGHKKTIKSYFIDKKIPSSQRDNIFLLADESHIMWIIGDRISSEYKIHENTKRKLVVEMIPYKESED